MHGGVVATASDLSFELVGSPDGAVIYVQDHGKPMKPTGLKGKLTVLNGAEKSQAELVVAGDKLEAKGIKLASGDKGCRCAGHAVCKGHHRSFHRQVSGLVCSGGYLPSDEKQAGVAGVGGGFKPSPWPSPRGRGD